MSSICLIAHAYRLSRSAPVISTDTFTGAQPGAVRDLDQRSSDALRSGVRARRRLWEVENGPRGTFDTFAGSFDQVLDQLGYRAPALIAELLERIGSHYGGAAAFR